MTRPSREARWWLVAVMVSLGVTAWTVALNDGEAFAKTGILVGLCVAGAILTWRPT